MENNIVSILVNLPKTVDEVCKSYIIRWVDSIIQMFIIMGLEYCTLNPTDYCTIRRNSFDLDNTKMIKYRIASLFYNNVHNFTINDLNHSKVNETDYYYLHISYL